MSRKNSRLFIALLLVAANMALACSAVPMEGDVATNGDVDVDDVPPPEDVPSGEDAAADATDATDIAEGPECPTSADEPAGLLLTWQQDPTSTMTIDWHALPGDDEASSLCLKEVGADAWEEKIDAQRIDPPFGEYAIYRVELSDLEPGSNYRFQAGEFERRFKFRTMPADIDDESVVFATGGDTQHAPDFLETTNSAALQYDIDFVAFGGDLAYADAGTSPIHLQLWEAWFEANLETLVDDDGRVVPILVGIGNHEVVDGYLHNHADYEQTDAWRLENAPYFYTLFAFPGQPGYAALDFGDYLTLLILDTDHSNPVDGEQAQWIEDTLVERHQRQVPHVFPIYHVPAFPSHRDFDDEISTRIRDHWVPLFEAYGVEVAFENHDHTYKRTHPIRDNELNEDDGIVYVGDGAWGVLTRSGESQEEWYIDQFASTRHAIIVTIQGDERHVLVVDGDGEVIDEMGPSFPGR